MSVRGFVRVPVRGSTLGKCEKKGRFPIENLEERIALAIVLVNSAGNTPQTGLS
jgi:hypothetical protein